MIYLLCFIGIIICVIIQVRNREVFEFRNKIFDEDGETKIRYSTDDSYSLKTTYASLATIIPSLKFSNDEYSLTRVKPGCLVQAVDTGHFHHIVRLVTAQSGEIYIQTTISDSITHAPEDLKFIG